ncbi:hypothetical protein ACFXO9_31465 [Nocardia tengchongensis]|uniref:hypothetical protein n=1 Tax=Nocardia tengchongensis TaxID=2055889 RepID=UPI0036771681
MVESEREHLVEVRDDAGTVYRIPAAVLNPYVVLSESDLQTRRREASARLAALTAQNPEAVARAGRWAQQLAERLDGDSSDHTSG